ncbi:MAG TPA: TIGR03084 family metal-binding protein [Acidimicrobiales bacterium]|nr:TIGR03084 family metal-binding protein [Acidimicrobiales bacterium]
MAPLSPAALLDDLRAEHDALDGRVAHLDADGWTTPTPADGWTVADSISHLAFFDRSAVLALTDADAFTAHLGELARASGADPDVALARTGDHRGLLQGWRAGRAELLAAATTADPTARVPWYGPAMGFASFVSARLMETWAHGQDVADALGLPPVTSDRLRHVCHLGVAARAYSFRVRGLTDPGDPVRVEAIPPGGGEAWTWGPHDAADRVTGSALDLALVLTQRRNRADTDITVDGPTAEAWLAVAQAFAGPAGPGRPPARSTSGQ